MMFCCDMSGPMGVGAGPTGTGPGLDNFGKPQAAATSDPMAVVRAGNLALDRAAKTTIIGTKRAGGKPVDTSQAAVEAAIASGDKQKLIEIFVAQGNTSDIAEKLAAVALSKATNVLYGDVPAPKPKFSFGGLPKIDPSMAVQLLQKPTVQTIPGVTPPTPAPPSSGGGGGGGGGGSSVAFAPPESEKPPEAQKVAENLPASEVKKSSAAIPLLALAAIAYYAFKG